MPRNFTDEDLDFLAERIINKKGGFHIDPESHYVTHERIDRFLDMWDAARKSVWKGFVSLFVFAVFAMIALTFGWHK